MSGLTRQIAIDYAGDRIHCNAICPGCELKTQELSCSNLTVTLVARTALVLKGTPPDHLLAIEKATPLSGIGDPNSVARAAVVLASDDAEWITGVNLPVDGGYSAQ